MSRHEGVSCDFCNKTNFKEKRFKCLRCLDYDLCLTCFELGLTVTNHPTDHPFQCILTQADYDLYFGGETVPRPQSFTCSICGKLGFTETLLVEHAITEHDDVSLEVVCPICVAMPYGDPHAVTEDFPGHLTREHGDAVFIGEVQRSSASTRNRRPNRSNRQFDPLSEILSQLARSRRSQQFRSHDPIRHNVQTRLERSDDFVVPVVPPRKSPSKPSDGSKYLLVKHKTSGTKKPDPEKLDENSAIRSCFIKQISFSTIFNNCDIPSVDLKFLKNDKVSQDPNIEKS